MRNESRKIYEASLAVIPGGVNSPVRAFPGLEMTPLVTHCGKGDRIWDEDGHSFIDYCGSWGALILGHAHPRIVEEACAQMRLGSSFGTATAIEQQLAAAIIQHLPSIEKIRFVSSGTEATMSVIRLARGYTGRSTIVKFNGNYHGHVDSLLVQAGSGVSFINAAATSLGVPEDLIRHTVSLPYNDIDGVREFLRCRKDIAAVLLEPVAGNMGVVPASPSFLQMLREETSKMGALLIFDEIISGFRVGLQGVQGIHGITPDLTCLGKIIGGGFPAAAFGGSREIMDHLAPLGQVYQAGTLSGNPVAMRAGFATLRELARPGFYAELEEKARLLLDPIQDYIATSGLPLCLNRAGSMFTLFFGVRKVEKRESLDVETFKRFFQKLFARGIYFPPSPYETAFVSAAHSAESLEITRQIVLDVLRELEDGLSSL